MDILTIGALGVVVLLLIALVRNTSVSRSTVGFGGGNVKKKQDTRRKTVAARHPYRATSIQPGEQACPAVQNIAGKRFLDVDRVTPELPLPACDADKCTCKYQHHEERRSEQEDRRHPGTLQSDLYGRSDNDERRKKRRGRRKSDWA